MRADTPVPSGTTLSLIHRVDSGPPVILHLGGELEATEVDQLRAAVADLDHNADLTIDLRDLSFVDSSGLGFLVRMRQDRVAAGGVVSFREPSAIVRRAITYAGLAEHFGIEPGGGGPAPRQ